MKKPQLTVGWGYAPKQFSSQLNVIYRLDAEKYCRLWELQKGRCAGCLCEFAHPLRKEMKVGIPPEIDHDHKGPPTRADGVIVRGLLCHSCNLLLGKIQDDENLLARLIAYLKNPPARNL